MVFIDASALIAIIQGEAEADLLSDRMSMARTRLCSALSIWETMSGLCRSYRYSVNVARADVQRYIASGQFRFAALGEPEYEIAADAYARFGKGRHPAGLNMGDCFSYACAKTNGARLLYKGEDFTRTDMAWRD